MCGRQGGVGKGLGGRTVVCLGTAGGPPGGWKGRVYAWEGLGTILERSAEARIHWPRRESSTVTPDVILRWWLSYLIMNEIAFEDGS